MNEELKESIALLTNGQLTSIGKKNLNQSSDLWKLKQKIISATPFIPDDFPFSIRIYHVANDLIALKTCACGCGTPMMRPKQNTIFGHKRDNTKANEKRRQTCLEKYGEENVAKSKAVKDKTIQTNLERYGVESTAAVKEFRDKQKKTCIERYGVEHSFQAQDIKDKIKKTLVERHGVESPLQSAEIKAKLKQTNIERYGVENVFQNEEIKAKIAETNLEKLGVENPRQSIEISDRIRQTCLEKFGVEHVFQSDEAKEKSRQTLMNRLGVDHQMRSQEIKAKLKETVLQEYGVEHVFQSDEVKQKIAETNLERYGATTFLQTAAGQEKSKKSLMHNYGVDNPAKSQEIQATMRRTFNDRYGADHPMQNEEVKQKSKETCLEKFGVEYSLQSQEVRDRINKTKIKRFYNYLVNGARLQQKVRPMFTLDEYAGSSREYDFECCRCGNIFKSDLEDGVIPRCLKCYPYLSGRSKLEIELGDFIEKLQIAINRNDRTILSPAELDIYLPEKKLAIEFNGLYYHGEASGKDKNYHLKKTLECESKGIRLIHVFEDELMNKRKTVYSRIKHILGSAKYKIGARKCDVRGIEAVDSNRFLDKYHIQGKDNAGIRLGLFYKNRLVAVMTFCKNRVALGRTHVEGEFELSRFATIAHFNVIGAADKLLKHFEREHRPVKILSYADRRWSIGGIYFKLGFELKHISAPNYWYVKNGQREHRFKYRKDRLLLEGFSKDLTEWQIMQEKGFDRIWDCGNYVFVKEY